MNVRGLLSWFLSPTFDAYGMSEFDMFNVAKMICNEAEKAEGVVLENCEHEFRELSVPAINSDNYQQHQALKPVLNILRILDASDTESIKYFFVHGSLADLKFVPGWSDLDTWVVISNQVFDSPERLMSLKSLFVKLNDELLKVDSIAHHGFIIALESDLDAYYDGLMPIEVLEKAVSLKGQADLTIKRNLMKSNWASRFQSIRETFTEFSETGVFKHHPYRGQYLDKNMLNEGEGMYQLKYLISWVLSFPSLYYTALGKPVYKSESFAPFSESFGELGLIVEEFSVIRSAWSKNEGFPYTPNSIPQWLIESLPENYIERIVSLLDAIIETVESKGS